MSWGFAQGHHRELDAFRVLGHEALAYHLCRSAEHVWIAICTRSLHWPMVHRLWFCAIQFQQVGLRFTEGKGYEMMIQVWPVSVGARCLRNLRCGGSVTCVLELRSL